MSVHCGPLWTTPVLGHQGPSPVWTTMDHPPLWTTLTTWYKLYVEYKYNDKPCTFPLPKIFTIIFLNTSSNINVCRRDGNVTVKHFDKCTNKVYTEWFNANFFKKELNVKRQRCKERIDCSSPKASVKTHKLESIKWSHSLPKGFTRVFP